MFTFLFIATLFQGALPSLTPAAAYAATHCQVFELDFVPYSSSYLSTRRGDLVRLKTNVPASARADVPADALRDSDHRTVLEKFLVSSQRVLERHAPSADLHQTPEFRTYAQKLYRPKSQSWEGFCDRWSAASLAPEVERILRPIDVAVCGGIVLTRSELRELTSALYEYSDDIYLGTRTLREPSARVKKYADRFGIDTLPAHELDAQAATLLSQKRGFSFDVDSGPEVWNQPVYRMNRCTETLDRAKLPATAFRLGVPAAALVAASPVMTNFLSRLQTAERHVQFYLPHLKNGGNFGGLPPPAFVGQRVSDLDFHFGDAELAEIRRLAPSLASAIDRMNRKHDFFTLRESWSKLVPELLRRNLIDFQPGLEVEKVRSDFRFKTESNFNTNSGSSEDMRTDYLIYRLKGEAIASSWITPLADRPDTLWAALPPNRPNGSSTLFKLLEHCFTGPELGFAGLYYRAAKEGQITAERASELVRAFEALPSAESRERVLRILDRDIAGMPSFKAIAHGLTHSRVSPPEMPILGPDPEPVVEPAAP